MFFEEERGEIFMFRYGNRTALLVLRIAVYT